MPATLARPTGFVDDSTLSSLALEIAPNTPIVSAVCPKCARGHPTPAHSNHLYFPGGARLSALFWFKVLAVGALSAPLQRLLELAAAV